jgi:polysaccharide export outer membrane protein
MAMRHAFLALIAITLTATVLPPVAVDASTSLNGDCTAAYVIGPDDVLDVTVWGNTEISRTVPVRPDGRISLPLLNDLQAAGLSPMALRDAVTKALQPFMPDASVSVLVREIHSVKVAVLGEVKTPGRYEIKDRATVLDVLAMAGGFSEFADRGGIFVLRQESGQTRQIRFDYGKLTSKNGRPGSNGAAALNFCVRAGDVVVVP